MWTMNIKNVNVRRCRSLTFQVVYAASGQSRVGNDGAISGSRRLNYANGVVLRRERPEICSWHSKTSEKSNWWDVPKSIGCGLSWQSPRGTIRGSSCGPSSDFLLTNPSSPWAEEGGQSSGGWGWGGGGGLGHSKSPREPPPCSQLHKATRDRSRNWNSMSILIH